MSFHICAAKTFEYVKITADDVGKKFKIGGIKFKIVDIYKNQLDIDVIDKNNSVESFDFKFVNLDMNGKKMVAHSNFKFAEMQRNDSTLNISDVPLKGRATLDKKIYEVFRQNPAITEAEYRRLMEPLFTSLIQNPGPNVSLEDVLGKN